MGAGGGGAGPRCAPRRRSRSYLCAARAAARGAPAAGGLRCRAPLGCGRRSAAATFHKSRDARPAPAFQASPAPRQLARPGPARPRPCGSARRARPLAGRAGVQPASPPPAGSSPANRLILGWKQHRAINNRGGEAQLRVPGRAGPAAGQRGLRGPGRRDAPGITARRPLSPCPRWSRASRLLPARPGAPRPGTGGAALARQPRVSPTHRSPGPARRERSAAPALPARGVLYLRRSGAGSVNGTWRAIN